MMRKAVKQGIGLLLAAVLLTGCGGGAVTKGGKQKVKERAAITDMQLIRSDSGENENGELAVKSDCGFIPEEELTGDLTVIKQSLKDSYESGKTEKGQLATWSDFYASFTDATDALGISDIVYPFDQEKLLKNNNRVPGILQVYGDEDGKIKNAAISTFFISEECQVTYEAACGFGEGDTKTLSSPVPNDCSDIEQSEVVLSGDYKAKVGKCTYSADGSDGKWQITNAYFAGKGVIYHLQIMNDTKYNDNAEKLLKEILGSVQA